MGSPYATPGGRIKARGEGGAFRSWCGARGGSISLVGAVAGAFSVGAFAIAGPEGNAVGAVRLTCARDRLEIELVRVSSFTAGFAPGAVARAVSFSVPYAAVRGLVRRGRVLCLALDPAVARPHNRFTLTAFTEDPGA